MGCDIHLHVEVKVTGRWLHYNAPDIKRDYDLFTKMAGVRRRGGDDIVPISKPRGLPVDTTETTKWLSEWDGSDGHSHSWLNADEIRSLDRWAREAERVSRIGGDWFDATFGWLCGSSMYQLKQYPECYPPDLEDVRLVFWFDN